MSLKTIMSNYLRGSSTQSELRNELDRFLKRDCGQQVNKQFLKKTAQAYFIGKDYQRIIGAIDGFSVKPIGEGDEDMKVSKHPNYYDYLLLRGAKVVSKLRMKAGSDRKGPGRMWSATATLQLKGIEYFLEANFHGAKAETEAVAAANMVVVKIVMHVEGGNEPDTRVFNRDKFGILMLSDGIYINHGLTKAISDEMRKMFPVDTLKYGLILSPEEYHEIRLMGYEAIIIW